VYIRRRTPSRDRRAPVVQQILIIIIIIPFYGKKTHTCRQSFSDIIVLNVNSIAVFHRSLLLLCSRKFVHADLHQATLKFYSGRPPRKTATKDEYVYRNVSNSNAD